MALPSPAWTGLAAALAQHPRYRPIKRLGKQSGRQTLLCKDCRTGGRVVIKLLAFGEDFAWDDLKLFEREAEVLRSLNHPAIPKYLDYFDLETSTTKGFALVQSYIPAQSLAQQLKAGRSFSEAEIQQIAEQLLRILKYLHGRQPAVIHRDIKPSNILLANRTAHSPGKVYLVDFGSVQTLVAREGGTVTVVGTYGYMPPEQFGGRAVPASDLYSLGATLIYLASGQHPADLPQINLQLQFEPFIQLEQKLIGWLKYLTEPSLEKRISSVEEAIVTLSSSQSNQPLAAASFAPSSTEFPISDLERENSPSNSSDFHSCSLFYSLRPIDSCIEITYISEEALQIRLPAQRLKLKDMDFSINLDDSGYIGSCLALLVIIFFAIIISMIVGGATGLLMLSMSFVLLICLALHLKKPSKQSAIIIDDQDIRVQQPNQVEQVFGHHRVWRLWNGNNYLRIMIGRHHLTLRGTVAEIHWLSKVLQSRLQLPIEKYVGSHPYEQADVT